MENNKIIKLNTSTKILYSLFNFFAPISLVFILVCYTGTHGMLATLYSIIGILAGLFYLISNLAKYNHFLCINEKTITICKGKIKNPKVIQIFKTENITLDSFNNGLAIEYENREIKLMHTSFSLLGTICYLGVLVAIIVLKNINSSLHASVELYETLPALFKEIPKKPSKTEDTLINIITWGFVLCVSAIGCLGLLFTPFYPFMNL